MAGGDDIGRASIRIDANTAPLVAGLEEVKAQTEETAATAEADFGRIEGAIRSTTSAAMSLRRALTRIFIPVTIALSLVRIIARLDEARAKADKLRATFADLGAEATRSLQRMSVEETGDEFVQQIQAVRDDAVKAKQALEAEALKQIEQISSRNVLQRIEAAATGGPTIEDVLGARDEQLRTIATNVERAIERIRERQKEAALAASAEAIRAEEEKNAEIERGLLDGIARVEAERLAARTRVIEQIEATEDIGVQRALRARLELINRIADAQRQAIADEDAERKRIEDERAQREAQRLQERIAREQEAADRQAKAFERAMTNALEQVQQRANSLNGAVAQSLESLRQSVQIIADNMGVGGRM